MVSDIVRLTRGGQGPLTTTGKGGERGPLACHRRREKLSTLQLTLQPNYGFAGESTGRDVRPACLTCPNIIEDQVVSKEKDITRQFINDLSKH